MYGKSGIGKSVFLRKTLCDRDALWLTSERMKQFIIDDVLGVQSISLGGYDYIVIDNIESIVGEATTERFSEILDRWADAGMSVVMTSCRPRWNRLNTTNRIRCMEMDAPWPEDEKG